MIPIKIPDWWDSIRAIIAFMLTVTFCSSIFIKEIPVEKVTALRELTLLALTFYYVLKKRPEENGKELPK